MASDRIDELRFAAGSALGVARWLQALGLLVAAVSAVVLLVRRSPAGFKLAAYDDSTGRPGRLLFSVVFFAALYGAPALLIREVARRNGWGWPSIIMLAFALGIIQPGVIDQALFSTDYRDIESWSRSLEGTFIEPLGFSATNALNFIPGHVIYSFCAPIAVSDPGEHRPAPVGLRPGPPTPTGPPQASQHRSSPPGTDGDPATTDEAR